MANKRAAKGGQRRRHDVVLFRRLFRKMGKVGN